MKNLKLIVLLLSLCLTSSTMLFAQEDERTMQEQAALKEQLARENDKGEVASMMLQELNVLREQYENASEAERPAIEEEIRALKKAYNSEVKGAATLQEAMDAKVKADMVKSGMAENEDLVEFNMSEKEAFISQSKLRLHNAKEKLAEQIANGEISEMDAKIKQIKINEIEEKLMNHITAVNLANAKIQKRKAELSELSQE